MDEARDREDFRAWAVIPAKRFARAKSRLHPALPPDQRRHVARALLRGVLYACSRTRALAGVLVVTDGDDVAELARACGAEVTRDAIAAGGALHAIVDSALAHVRSRGATHGLVLMSDLPELRARDVTELVAALRASPFVLVPDPQRLGTSALGVQLDLGARTRFGSPDSLHRHLREAARVGRPARLVLNPRARFDLDTAADLARLTGRDV